MFWNDIKEIKQWMRHISDRLSVLDQYARNTTEDEKDAVDRLHDKMDVLINDQKRFAQVALAEKILDKFEDYMKNVDKLNGMINEFKGCVSMSRAAISEKKEMDDMRTMLENMIKTFQKYHDYHKSFNNQYFKIDAIHKALCEKEEEKKAAVKKKPVKKKKAVPDSLSE